jgi:hypothetical protein
MNLSLPTESLDAIMQRLADADARFHQRYPGGVIDRQPVHSVYGGAQLFKVGGHLRLGNLALASMDAYAPNFAVFARALGLPGAEALPELAADAAAPTIQPATQLAHTLYARVREKLARVAGRGSADRLRGRLWLPRGCRGGWSRDPRRRTAGRGYGRRCATAVRRHSRKIVCARVAAARHSHA